MAFFNSLRAFVPLIAILLQVHVPAHITAQTVETTAIPSRYRMEVEFLRFENLGGVKYNGNRCDTLFGSKCDPEIYAAIQTDGIKPLLNTPPHKTYQLFTMVKYAHNENVFDVNQVIRKDVCDSSIKPEMVGAFVRVIDYDMTKTDLIEDFVCNVRDGAPAWEDGWSEVGYCQGRYQPIKIKLSYRWRRVTLTNADCLPKIPLNFYRSHPSFPGAGVVLATTTRRTPPATRPQSTGSYQISDQVLDYTILSG